MEVAERGSAQAPSSLFVAGADSLSAKKAGQKKRTACAFILLRLAERCGVQCISPAGWREPRLLRLWSVICMLSGRPAGLAR